ncbi:MAG: HAD family hydrolase [Gammaproteobacteria bacterium]|jgi:FMN phosphatase YigB (HAD superfamily)
MAFLDRYDALVFDLNGTLAEDFDRFGPGQDYAATYRRLGSGSLMPDEVGELVESLMARLLERYESGPVDPFPNFTDFLADTVDLPRDEWERIEELVAFHEMGSISRERVESLRILAGSHRLALVSDLWAPSGLYRRYLETSGVSSVFRSMVFSCDLGAVKPSPRMFRKALTELDVPAGRAVFIGDNETRDILGAAACGMATVWIDSKGTGPGVSRPDRVIESVEELAGLV